MRGHRFNTIVLHFGAHIEERFGEYLLRRNGDETFPGISTAKTLYVDAGFIPTPSADERELNHGQLWVGVGGGRLDEHPVPGGRERKEGECAATLVAEALDLAPEPALEHMLRWVTKDDLEGSGGVATLGNVLKTFHTLAPFKPEVGVEWVMQAFDTYRRNFHRMGVTPESAPPATDVNFIMQMMMLDSEKRAWTWAHQALDAQRKMQRLFADASEDFFDESKTCVVQMTNARSAPIRIVASTSGNPQFARFAHSRLGCRASMVIQRKPNGHTYIHVHGGVPFWMDAFVRRVRLAEFATSGRGGPPPNPDALADEGTTGSVPEWCYCKNASPLLLNGSLTALAVHPSRLSLKKLTAIAIEVARASTHR